MFFTAKQLHAAFEAGRVHVGDVCYDRSISDNPTLKDCRRIIRQAFKQVRTRQIDDERDEQYDFETGEWSYTYGLSINVYKWARPWDVVPELTQLGLAAGEYSVGLEIERQTGEDYEPNPELEMEIIKKIQRWKHIAIDAEGADGLEVTFPPVRYDRFNRGSQAIRYTALLNQFATEDSTEFGIHVNVGLSEEDTRTFDQRVLRIIYDAMSELNWQENRRYFGRDPYGYCNQVYHRPVVIEWKLFLSVTDPDRVMQYTDIAVALTDFMVKEKDFIIANVTTENLERPWGGVYTTRRPNQALRDRLREVLEMGYNKRAPKLKQAA